MSFLALARARRSVFQFDVQRQVSWQDLEPLLEAGHWAPNHHLTQPWRFLVLGQQTQAQLAEVYAHARALKQMKTREGGDELFAQFKARAVERFMAMPVVVMVACQVVADPLQAEEDYAACCCAVQNLLLAAADAGLGAQWSTHPMIADAQVVRQLGLDSDGWRLVAMVYVGWPKMIPPPPPRRLLQEVVVRLP